MENFGKKKKKKKKFNLDLDGSDSGTKEKEDVAGDFGEAAAEEAAIEVCNDWIFCFTYLSLLNPLNPVYLFYTI